MKTDATLPISDLPLDWTRMKRQCSNVEHLRRRDRAMSAFDPKRSIQIDVVDESDDDNPFICLAGRAIFCLHEINAEWFQGQFLPLNSSRVRSLGLLCTLREMDDCMVCLDGGYRELDVKVIRFGGSEGSSIPREQVIQCLSTGGDMMRMRSEDTLHVDSRLSFDAEKVIVGTKSVPYLMKYFRSLVREVFPESFQNEANVANELDIRLPNCVIAIGAMILRVPNEFLSK